jgi:hypothetical protein
MTPSGWGDDAQSRDAGHDEMQARSYRDWRKRIEDSFTLDGDGKKKFVADTVYVEHPFMDAGRLIGFADIAVRFVADDEWFWWYEEIKPRIYSVGAVIRQCLATEVSAQRAIKSSRRGNGYHGRAPDFVVYAVVYRDDPKAALLRELHPSTICISRESAP